MRKCKKEIHNIAQNQSFVQIGIGFIYNISNWSYTATFKDFLDFLLAIFFILPYYLYLLYFISDFFILNPILDLLKSILSSFYNLLV